MIDKEMLAHAGAQFLAALMRRVPGGRQGRPRIGLVLGSGAARGWAHLGVIKALNEAGIPIDMVAGTSAGALVGAAYASGGYEGLLERSLTTSWKDMVYYFSELPQRSGLISGKKVQQLIDEFVTTDRFEALEIPFRCVATDIWSGEPVVLAAGDLRQAVRASISIPGLFTPVEWGELLLVDGALVNPVPVSVMREMGADFIIAVDVNQGGMAPAVAVGEHDDSSRSWPASLKSFDLGTLPWVHGNRGPHFVEILTNSLRVMECQISATQLAHSPPDLLIKPDLSDVNMLVFSRMSEVVRVGYEATRKVVTQI